MHSCCCPAVPAADLCLATACQSDLRLAKEKAKRKQAIILRQEEEVAAKEQALAQLQRDSAATKQEMEGLQVGRCRWGLRWLEAQS
jgi:hypothetical protein